MYQKLSQTEEYLASQIVDIAFRIHKELGPGLLEVFMLSVFIMSSQKGEFSLSGNRK